MHQRFQDQSGAQKTFGNPRRGKEPPVFRVRTDISHFKDSLQTCSECARGNQSTLMPILRQGIRAEIQFDGTHKDAY